MCTSPTDCALMILVALEKKEKHICMDASPWHHHLQQGLTEAWVSLVPWPLAPLLWPTDSTNALTHLPRNGYMYKSIQCIYMYMYMHVKKHTCLLDARKSAWTVHVHVCNLQMYAHMHGSARSLTCGVWTTRWYLGSDCDRVLESFDFDERSYASSGTGLWISTQKQNYLLNSSPHILTMQHLGYR